MIVVMGGSGSGKSAYAEQLVMEQPERNRYYLATMRIYDAEGEKKVARHRRMRAEKGFATIECPTDIAKNLPKEKGTVLLECMSNLVANELFSDGIPVDGAKRKAVVEKVVSEVALLKQHATELIVVTNNVFEDGIRYDEGTMEYLKALGEINTGISAMAEEVIEVVVGIPIQVKAEQGGVGGCMSSGHFL